jgi:hypothetical protein
MANPFTAKLAKIEHSDRPELFVLSVDHPITREVAERLRVYWARAGGDAFGKILVLDGGVTLTALTGPQLRDLGLMRILEPEAEKAA